MSILHCSLLLLVVGQNDTGGVAVPEVTPVDDSGGDTRISPLAMIAFGIAVGGAAVGCVQVMKRKEQTRKERVAQGMKAARMIKNTEEENPLYNVDAGTVVGDQRTASIQGDEDYQYREGFEEEEEEEEDPTLDRVVALFTPTTTPHTITKSDLSTFKQDDDLLADIVAALDSGSVTIEQHPTTRSRYRPGPPASSAASSRRRRQPPMRGGGRGNGV